MPSAISLQDQELTLSPAPLGLIPLDPPVAEPILELGADSPFASQWSVSLAKRFFDISVAVVVLIVSALPMLGIAILIRLSSQGPALFVQQRVGRRGSLFPIYKFRSMIPSSGKSSGPGLTRDGDSRITAVGRILRKLKLDELPQFYNILRGDMSLIGPRPKLPQYAAIRNMPFRPGITGAATLAFRREEEVLRHVHPSLLDAFYNQHIRPMKANIDLNYMAHATLWSDMRIVAATFLACVMPMANRHIPVNQKGRESRNLDMSALPYLNKDQTCEGL
jgi:lipopolysaccharide/colanic/teichoic acid biosynthesis glycosyltransferase